MNTTAMAAAAAEANKVRQASEKADVALQKNNIKSNEGLGVALRHFRTLRGWTLEAVAKAAKLSESTLNKLERGGHSPTVRTLVAVCNVLNIDVAELLRVSRLADRKEGVLDIGAVETGKVLA